MTIENTNTVAMNQPAPGTPGGTLLCQAGISSCMAEFRCMSSMVDVLSVLPTKTKPGSAGFRIGPMVTASKAFAARRQSA
jgi:hypothetical protein